MIFSYEENSKQTHFGMKDKGPKATAENTFLEPAAS